MAVVVRFVVCFASLTHALHLRGHTPAVNGPRMDNVALRKGIEELTIANDAVQLAAASATDVNISQQNFLALTAVAAARKPWEKIRPMLPEAKAQLILIRQYLAEAGEYADHAREVLNYDLHKVPSEAATHAVDAIIGWIKEDAGKSAAKAASVNKNPDRLAAAVASAAEPYHIALLRNQKFCNENYAKAKSAHDSAVKLVDEAKKVATDAQKMQEAYMGLDAQTTWGIASNMMNEAEQLRQWSLKLYNQANTACGTAGGYELAEQQAAANAAGTTILNAPMQLPPAAS